MCFNPCGTWMLGTMLSHQCSTSCPPRKPETPPWETTHQQFRNLPSLRWLYLCVWCLGLKDTIQVLQALQGLDGLPDVLLDLAPAALEMGQAALPADRIPLCCIGFHAYNFATFQNLTPSFLCKVSTSGLDFKKKYNFQQKQLSGFGWTHVILSCSNSNIILTVIITPIPCNLGRDNSVVLEELFVITKRA